jgi:glycosyltransferase involved in cell wall biosynthesis
MRIVNILTCFNELHYIPYVIHYYQKHNIEVFVLDNYSTDGSWEWLQKHNIPSERVDTGGAFHMDILQKARLDKMRELKPDWVIYGDADEFIVGVHHPIEKLIRAAEDVNVNLIKTRKFEFYNTGEKRPKESKSPKDIFYYYEESWLTHKGCCRIHKYYPNTFYVGDAIFVPETKVGRIDAFILNYGGTKTKEQRNEIMERTRKAWAMGMHPIISSLYLEHEERKWIWDRETLSDIRNFEPLNGFIQNE